MVDDRYIKSYVAENVIDSISFSTIKPSTIHGNGLFATCDIPKGTVLGTLDGQVLNWDFYDKIRKTVDFSSPTLFYEWNALEEDTLLVRPFRTKYSFINHSRTPNCELVHYPLRVVTLVDIKAGDEFTLDYRKERLRREYLEGHGKEYL